ALQFPALVAELRSAAVADGDMPVGRRGRAAAEMLAVLARAGVGGADPAGWYGVAEPSTDRPWIGPDQEVRLSPSQVETLLQCPLRGVMQSHGGRGAPSDSSLLGV